jgi:hypothetical protein
MVIVEILIPRRSRWAVTIIKLHVPFNSSTIRRLIISYCRADLQSFRLYGISYSVITISYIISIIAHPHVLATANRRPFLVRSHGFDHYGGSVLLLTRPQPRLLPNEKNVIHSCQFRGQQWCFDMVCQSLSTPMKFTDIDFHHSVVALASLICVNSSPPLFDIYVDKPENSGLLYVNWSTLLFTSRSGNVSVQNAQEDNPR